MKYIFGDTYVRPPGQVISLRRIQDTPRYTGQLSQKVQYEILLSVSFEVRLSWFTLGKSGEGVIQ